MDKEMPEDTKIVPSSELPEQPEEPEAEVAVLECPVKVGDGAPGNSVGYPMKIPPTRTKITMMSAASLVLPENPP